MKRNKKIISIICSSLIMVTLGFHFAVASGFGGDLREFNGTQNFIGVKPLEDSSKKTVFIIADNEGTEMLDLLAPYYLFNATGQANVYVVSEKKQPIRLINSLFILPHFTFSEIDSLNIKADILVIPNITLDFKAPQKVNTLNWIKKQYTGENIILSICDGAATMAATGLYDGKLITSHAYDLAALQKQFRSPKWVKDVTVTQSGNLYSTAGVPNGVEGSLTVIKRVFGDETLQKVLLDINYPHPDIKLEHTSKIITTGAKFSAMSRILIKERKNMGVLLQDEINEFALGSLLDVYARTFPRSINSFSIDNEPRKSKYGLTIIPSGNFEHDPVDEIHILNTDVFTVADKSNFAEATVKNYALTKNQYIIDLYLENIQKSYGKRFMNFVKLTLDYN